MYAPLPRSMAHLVIRTDFADQAAWEVTRTIIETPTFEGFEAGVQFVEDPAYQEISVPALMELTPGGPQDHRLVMVADHTTMSDEAHPILVVRLYGRLRGQTLRVVASELWSIENNLAIANMDWEEFVAAADDDGVFRGF